MGMMVDERWSSVSEMTRAADLVVVGRIVALVPWGDPRNASYDVVVHVAVDEVLKGKPIPTASSSEIVTFSLLPAAPLPTPRGALPSNSHVFFLGEGDSESSEYRATPLQDVFADVNGSVEIPLARQIREMYGAREFPLSERGKSFEDFLDDIRRAASASASEPLAVSASLLAC
jgi:hypothetical protein